LSARGIGGRAIRLSCRESIETMPGRKLAAYGNVLTRR
jgi:hypothetical protein